MEKIVIYSVKGIPCCNHRVGLNLNLDSNLFPVVTDYKKLPAKYCIVLNLYPHLSDTRYFNKNTHLDTKYLIFPENVQKDITQGNVKIIVSSGWETAFAIKKFNQTEPIFDFHKFSDIFKCSLDNIVYLIPNEVNTKFPVKHIVYNHSLLVLGSNHWSTEYYKTNVQKKLHQIQSKSIVKYRGLLYARKPRLERLMVLSELHRQDLLSYFNYSLLYNIKNKQQIINQAQQYYNTDISQYVNCIKTPVYSTDSLLDIYPNQEYINAVDWGHSLSSSFQIVVESLPETTNFITEKSIKPFTMLQPFIVFGSASTVQKLRDKNFDVFDNIIDHNYDNILNDTDRYNAFIQEALRLAQIKQKEWSNILESNKGRLIHNLNTIQEYAQQSDPADSLLYKYLISD